MSDRSKHIEEVEAALVEELAPFKRLNIYDVGFEFEMSVQAVDMSKVMKGHFGTFRIGDMQHQTRIGQEPVQPPAYDLVQSSWKMAVTDLYKLDTRQNQVELNERLPRRIGEVIDTKRETLLVDTIEPQMVKDGTVNDAMKESILPPELSDQYCIGPLIARGTFGHVYEAELVDLPGHKLALKYIHPLSAARVVLNEMDALRKLGGKHNVAPLLAAHSHSNGAHTLVLPHMPHDNFQSYFRQFGINEARLYIRALCESLSHVHVNSIIHRDVKPSNFLYNRKEARFMLVDFGLCEIRGETLAKCSPQKRALTKRRIQSKSRLHANRSTSKAVTRVGLFSARLACDVRRNELIAPSFGRKHRLPRASRSGTRGFRAPEVLLRVQCQTAAIDMWSVGVIFLSILSRRYPFFHSADDATALVELSHVFGSELLSEAAALVRRHITLPQYVEATTPTEVCKRLGGTHTLGSEEWPPDAYDLLEKLLELDPSKRISAMAAMQHPFLACAS